MGMLNVKVPLLGLCEFPFNIVFTNIECVSLSKPIHLECNEKLDTTL